MIINFHLYFYSKIHTSKTLFIISAINIRFVYVQLKNKGYILVVNNMIWLHDAASHHAGLQETGGDNFKDIYRHLILRARAALTCML